MRKGEEEAEIKNETVQARNRFSQIVNTPLPASHCLTTYQGFSMFI